MLNEKRKKLRKLKYEAKIISFSSSLSPFSFPPIFIYYSIYMSFLVLSITFESIDYSCRGNYKDKLLRISHTFFFWFAVRYSNYFFHTSVLKDENWIIYSEWENGKARQQKFLNFSFERCLVFFKLFWIWHFKPRTKVRS